MAKKTTTTPAEKSEQLAETAAPKPVRARKSAAAKVAQEVHSGDMFEAPPSIKATAVQSAPAQISLDDVALRAYFISEKRRAHGIPGDEHQDWINAEREFQEEAQPTTNARKR